MKNYVKEYAGHQVPKGATHYNEANILWPECFIDAKYGRIHEIGGSGWDLASKTMPITAIELPEVPQEWKGEGLPPVGCRCSATWLELPDGGCNDFCEVAIKGYFYDEVWLSKVNGVGCSDVLKVKDCEFRPLKTQQEKDREAFVDAARKATNADENDIVATDIFDDMFHAGFTAPKAGDNDK